LAREYGIPAVRLVREDWRASVTAGTGRPFRSAALALTFAWLSQRAQRLAREAGLAANDHLFGLLHDGAMTEDYLLKLLPRLRPGVTEIYSHPATHADAELLRAAPGYRRADELAALVSPRVQEALAQLQITLTDFRELAGKPCHRP
jgi:predicted glycoside hydrolase/deacetylase ChbG (UPF0249 family)